MAANRARSREIRERMRTDGVPYSVAARRIAEERKHAGLGLPCDQCNGPCSIDDQPTDQPAEV